MKFLSLRFRLIILFVVVACTVWAGAGIVAWNESKSTADEFFDTYQMALARVLASSEWSVVTPETQKRTDKIIKSIRNADEDDDAIGFAVFNNRGKLIFHDNENGKDFKYQDITSKFINQKVDGDDWRLVWLKSADGNFTIAVGQELEYREDMAWDMLEEFMVPWAAGLITLLVMMIGLISYELKPLKKMADEISNRKADNLTPLDDSNLPKEIKPLTKAMNRQLQQISELLHRERRFISDAAHELRTPLTALKIQLDVAKMSDDDAQTRDAALLKLEQGIERSTRLVEQLLALSRLEVSLETVQNSGEVVDWNKIIEQLINEHRFDLEAKKINLQINIDNGPIKNANPVLIALMLRNLIDNAIKYAPENASLIVRSNQNEIQIINSGTFVDEKYLSKLGERFFRVAGQNEKGSGIGLSIVKCIAEFYGCKLSFA
ncbi:MAG: sensor histidine kinase N-terminal domain-containing protein, partial [Alphaproteobacteria bacterium]|nr:sensor histidine kinase N-terminal domain-containing protein [Alphaproteobacteria bacterium]